jgi:hypothetical protein
MNLVKPHAHWIQTDLTKRSHQMHLIQGHRCKTALKQVTHVRINPGLKGETLME